MKRLSQLRWLQPSPGSVAAQERLLGRSHWTNFVHLIWSVWVFLTPAFSTGSYGFTPRWFLLTLLSYPLFLWLYAMSVLAAPRRSRLAALGMVLLCLALLPWYPSGLSYFVFGCVMLQPQRSRSVLRYLGVLALLNVVLMSYARYIGYPWQALVWMPTVTAIGLLLGLLRADSGSVELFGQDPRELAARRKIGVMLQTAGLPERLRVGELLAQARSYYPDARSIADCVALAGLDGLLDRPYGKLSGGQQRRVQFAIAVCGRPALLFLDEPTTGLDIDARQKLWQAIRELVAQGSGVLLTTHYLEEAEALSDRVVVLDRGKLVAEGSVREIRAHVSQRRVRCITAVDAGVAARWPGVREAVRDGEYLCLVADAAEPVVRRLLDADPTLHELEVQRAGLADAFLELTRNNDDTTVQQQEAA